MTKYACQGSEERRKGARGVAEWWGVSALRTRAGKHKVSRRPTRTDEGRIVTASTYLPCYGREGRKREVLFLCSRLANASVRIPFPVVDW